VHQAAKGVVDSYDELAVLLVEPVFAMKEGSVGLTVGVCSISARNSFVHVSCFL
jgi:hypothetical protein